MFAQKFVRILNSKPYFRFFSSVQLAVPLLVLLGIVVAIGTIIESRYNTEYARIWIYDADWFHGLMVLLWLNIFLATISRYPFKRHHLGFVIVHIGLLTLLIGGLLTGRNGIDGQLRVVENSRSSTVVLPQLSLQLIDVQADSALHADLNRGHSRLTSSDLDSLNEHFNSKIIARDFLPFAEVRESFESQPDSQSATIALSFMLKSPFFNVNEWLVSNERPELKMGPATVRLIVDKDQRASVPLAVKRRPSRQTPGQLIVRDRTSGKVLSSVALPNLKVGMKLGPYLLTSFKTYKRAAVVDNRLSEGDPQSDLNPAIELTLKQGEASVREVAYARYPDFSLSQMKGQPIATKFTYLPGGQIDQTESSTEPGSRDGNVIEFHVAQSDDHKIRVELYKNGESVMKQAIVPGESLVTPWMGIRLTLGSVVHNAVMRTEVSPAVIEPRSELPPSAIFVTPAGAKPDQGFWLAEDQFRRVSILGREYEVFFGRRTLQLPFSIQLQEFRKMDYPGTETAMSYESQILVNGQDPPLTVSMNEPLTRDGYTLYQSSYELRPGQPKVSIFSVNRDPGRLMKYIGSLILGLGIIIFTLMRSRFYTRRSSP